MRNCLNVLIVLISINTFSQNLVCCNNIEEVKKVIQGDWKLIGETKNVIYRFSFNNNKGFIEVLEELNLPPKALVNHHADLIIDEHTLVNIKSKNGRFFIELISMYYQISEQIFVLNDEKFVYGKGQFEHVFIRDKG